jgi:hypothetical protein
VSNEFEFGQLAIKMRRQFVISGAIPHSARRVGIDQIAPALMRALGNGRQNFYLCGADNIDPPVLAVFEAQNLLPRNDAMFDDPVKEAADQFLPAFGPHPCRHPQLAFPRPFGHPPCKSFYMRAADRDFGEVEFGHSLQMGAM